MKSMIVVCFAVAVNCQHWLPPAYQMYKTTKRPYDDPLRHRLYYNPNNGYEAYWADGEWHIRNPGDWDKSNGTTTRVPTVCGDECPYLYTRVGKVCGRHFYLYEQKGCSTDLCGHSEYGNTFIAGTYQTFLSYCRFLDAKCKVKDPYTKWSLIHVGECYREDFHKKLYPPNSANEHVFERLSQYLDDYNANVATLKYLPSNYTKTTTATRVDAWLLG